MLLSDVQEVACTAHNINSMLLHKDSVESLFALECVLEGTHFSATCLLLFSLCNSVQ